MSLDTISLVLCLVGRHRGMWSRSKAAKDNRKPVCSEWENTKGLENFIRWSLDNGFSPELELDRRDPRLGYSPDNCQWITGVENRDKDLLKKYEYEGVRYTLKGYCYARKSDVRYGTVCLRLKAGWPLEEAVMTPSTRGNRWHRQT